MSLLPALMLTLTLAVLITVVPRIVSTWIQFSEQVAAENREGLVELLRQENWWVVRHFVCATFGVALIIMMESMPAFAQTGQLENVTAGYVMISFLFALSESQLALKISSFLSSESAPVRVSRY